MLCVYCIAIRLRRNSFVVGESSLSRKKLGASNKYDVFYDCYFLGDMSSIILFKDVRHQIQILFCANLLGFPRVLCLRILTEYLELKMLSVIGVIVVNQSRWHPRLQLSTTCQTDSSNTGEDNFCFSDGESELNKSISFEHFLVCMLQQEEILTCERERERQQTEKLSTWKKYTENTQPTHKVYIFSGYVSLLDNKSSLSHHFIYDHDTESSKQYSTQTENHVVTITHGNGEKPRSKLNFCLNLEKDPWERWHDHLNSLPRKIVSIVQENCPLLSQNVQREQATYMGCNCGDGDRSGGTRMSPEPY